MQKHQYFCLLTPARPSMHETVTPAEQAVFARHCQYLTDRFHEKQVLHAGTSFETGQEHFAVVIVSAASKADAVALIAADPAVADGLLLARVTEYNTFLDRSAPSPTFLRHVEIFVSDPLRSKAFYEDVLGFETTQVQSGQYVWMRLGDREIMLRPGQGGVNGRAFAASQYNLVICSEEPVAVLERMKAKGLEIRGDDQGCPTFTDPDGNWFQLIGLDGTFPAV